MTGTGTTTVSGTTALGVGNGTETLGRNLTLNGNASWTGLTQVLNFNAGSGATMTIGAGSTLTDSVGTSATIAPTGGSATGLLVANAGTYLKNGGGPTTVSVPFNNGGTVSVQ